jgi:hypothetical protein
MVAAPRVRRPRLAGNAAALLLALVSNSARADVTKAQCVKANADAQVLRMSGKLAEAKTLLETCVDPTCPALVRADCAQRLEELDRAQPAIVFDVKDATGADVSPVSVTIDDKLAPGNVSGKALRADPGDHTFTFTAPGQPSVTRRFVLKEGERERRERIVLAAPRIPSPVAAGSSASGPPTDDPQSPAALDGSSPGTPPVGSTGTMSAQTVLAIVLGGVGLAGVAVGSIFGVDTFSAASQQRTDCQSGTSCSNRAQALSDHSTAATDGMVSTIGLAAGGALLAAGAILFFTAPHATQSQSTGLVVSPGVAPGGGAVWLRTEF